MAAFDAADHAFLLKEAHPAVKTAEIKRQFPGLVHAELRKGQGRNKGHILPVLRHVPGIPPQQGIVFLRFGFRMDIHMGPVLYKPVGHPEPAFVHGHRIHRKRQRELCDALGRAGPCRNTGGSGVQARRRIGRNGQGNPDRLRSGGPEGDRLPLQKHIGIVRGRLPKLIGAGLLHGPVHVHIADKPELYRGGHRIPRLMDKGRHTNGQGVQGAFGADDQLEGGCFAAGGMVFRAGVRHK
ncbi:MAG: hypothetical protein BWY09_00635 [Candidatus Hydrogenedentes bacterium ADurb.Bin179]|nr:MAG: hypothetical protein BWY09_00635 [Candidatus Hydrogenedentes bacterium ADurb.Bin179]